VGEADTDAHALFQWDAQTTIQRIVAELQRRNYVVWLDTERMKVRRARPRGAALSLRQSTVPGISIIFLEKADRSGPG
jgi:hypothetical protein